MKDGERRRDEGHTGIYLLSTEYQFSGASGSK